MGTDIIIEKAIEVATASIGALLGFFLYNKSKERIEKKIKEEAKKQQAPITQPTKA